MSGWPLHPLGLVAQIERDMIQPEQIKAYLPYLGLEHIESGGNILGAGVIEEGELKSTKFRFSSEHLLYGKLRPYLSKIAAPDFAGVCSTEIVPVRPGPRLDRRFLLHFLRQPSQVQIATARSTGANLPRISPSELARLEVPVPPLPVQRRIAAILDQADALRAKRRAALAHLDEMAQAIFVEMFGSILGNRRNLPVVRLDTITDCLDAKRRPIKAFDRAQGSVPYYGANGKQGWIDRAIFDEPLVLLAEDGGHFDRPERGVAYRIDGPAWVNNHAHILRARVEYLETEYLYRALRHYDFSNYISGTTRAKLTQQQMNSAKIMLPSLEEQKNFSNRVGLAEDFISVSRQSLTEMEALFTSLQHQAFTGAL